MNEPQATRIPLALAALAAVLTGYAYVYTGWSDRTIGCLLATGVLAAWGLTALSIGADRTALPGALARDDTWPEVEAWETREHEPWGGDAA